MPEHIVRHLLFRYYMPLSHKNGSEATMMMWAITMPSPLSGGKKMILMSAKVGMLPETTACRFFSFNKTAI